MYTDTRTRTRERHTTTTTTTTTTHNHYDDHYSAPPRRSSGPPIDTYLTLGMGMSGLASPNLASQSLTGTELNLGLGVKAKFLGLEMGVNGGGYSLEQGSDISRVSVIGGSMDLKLQPAFSIIEPYAIAGIGGYAMQGNALPKSQGSLALRLGAGVDLRFADFAVSLRYLYQNYGLTNHGIYKDVTTRSQSLGLNLLFYF